MRIRKMPTGGIEPTTISKNRRRDKPLDYTYSNAKLVSRKRRCYGLPFSGFHTFFGVFAPAKNGGGQGEQGQKTGGFILGNYFKFRRSATPLDQVRDATTIETNNGPPLLPTFALAFFVFAWAYRPPLQYVCSRIKRTQNKRDLLVNFSREMVKGERGGTC